MQRVSDAARLILSSIIDRKKDNHQATGLKRNLGVPRGILQYYQSPQLCPKRYRPPDLRGKRRSGSAGSSAYDSRSDYLDRLSSFTADPVRAETAFLILLPLGEFGVKQCAG